MISAGTLHTAAIGEAMQRGRRSQDGSTNPIASTSVPLGPSQACWAAALGILGAALQPLSLVLEKWQGKRLPQYLKCGDVDKKSTAGLFGIARDWRMLLQTHTYVPGIAYSTCPGV